MYCEKDFTSVDTRRKHEVRKTCIEARSNTEDVAAIKNEKVYNNMDEMKEEDSQDIGQASEEESDIDDSLGTLSFLLC